MLNAAKHLGARGAWFQAAEILRCAQEYNTTLRTTHVSGRTTQDANERSG